LPGTQQAGREDTTPPAEGRTLCCQVDAAAEIEEIIKNVDTGVRENKLTLPSPSYQAIAEPKKESIIDSVRN
jgi:hypothetical protein